MNYKNDLKLITAFVLAGLIAILCWSLTRYGKACIFASYLYQYCINLLMFWFTDLVNC